MGTESQDEATYLYRFASVIIETTRPSEILNFKKSKSLQLSNSTDSNEYSIFRIVGNVVIKNQLKKLSYLLTSREK